MMRPRFCKLIRVKILDADSSGVSCKRETILKMREQQVTKANKPVNSFRNSGAD